MHVLYGQQSIRSYHKDHIWPLYVYLYTAKVPYLPEIITIGADVVIVTFIHLYLMVVKEPAGFDIFYLILTAIIPILAYIFYKVFAVHQVVLEHTGHIKNIRDSLKHEVGYQKGETEILRFLCEKRDLSKENFYAVWCIDYTQPLDSYFEQEETLYRRGITRHRLINKNYLRSRSEDIKRHLLKNEEAIRMDKYRVHSSDLTDFELIICDRAINNQDAIAIQLFKDTANPRVELAVYSNDQSFVQSMRDVFNHNIRNTLRIKPNADFTRSIEEWLNS